ncbi:MAG: hypothetical protein RID02_13630 [Gracilimonas sp.]
MTQVKQMIKEKYKTSHYGLDPGSPESNLDAIQGDSGSTLRLTGMTNET